METTRIHGTMISIDGQGVLLLGPSGSGKSDLALRMIDRGAKLVADDQIFIAGGSEAPVCNPADRLEGLVEVRGLGIIRLPHAVNVPLRLILELVPAAAVPRLPDSAEITILNHAIPVLRLNPFETSTPIKIEFAIRNPNCIGSGGVDERKNG